MFLLRIEVGFGLVTEIQIATMDVRFARRNDAFKRGVFRPDAVFVMQRAPRAGRVVSVVMIRVRIGECRA